MLNDKVAIITGSTQGIGKAIASALADAGATVVINSQKSIDEGKTFAASLPQASYCQADVSNENDCKMLIDYALKHHGHLDIVINNVGLSYRIPHEDLEAVTTDKFQALLNSNLWDPGL